jgi:uncharacterized coiled-coil protein SlyX
MRTKLGKERGKMKYLDEKLAAMENTRIKSTPIMLL